MKPRQPLSTLPSSTPELSAFIKELSEDYYSYRLVEFDAGSLYRALGQALLEHFARPFTPVEDLELFYKQLYYQDIEICDDKYLDSFVIVLEALWRLIEIKQNLPERSFSAVGVLCASEDFMKAYNQVLRCRAYKGFMKRKPVEAYSEGNDEEYLNILNLEENTDACDLYGLCEGLNVTIVRNARNLENFEDYWYTYKGRREEGNTLVVHLARLDGFYFILYPKALSKLETEEQGEYRTLPCEGAEGIYQEVAFKLDN